ncbi:hypothetical protein Tco_1505633 [Tanacetum coccineum]
MDMIMSNLHVASWIEPYLLRMSEIWPFYENYSNLVIMLNFEGWKPEGYQANTHFCVVLKMVLVGQVMELKNFVDRQSLRIQDNDLANSDEARTVSSQRARMILVEELSRNVHYLLKSPDQREVKQRVGKNEEKCNEEMKGKLGVEGNYKYEMMARDKERLEMTLANVHVMMADRLGWYDMDERSNDAIDVLKTYGTTPPPGLQDPSNDP